MQPFHLTLPEGFFIIETYERWVKTAVFGRGWGAVFSPRRPQAPRWAGLASAVGVEEFYIYFEGDCNLRQEPSLQGEKGDAAVDARDVRWRRGSGSGFSRCAVRTGAQYGLYHPLYAQAGTPSARCSKARTGAKMVDCAPFNAIFLDFVRLPFYNRIDPQTLGENLIP